MLILLVDVDGCVASRNATLVERIVSLVRASRLGRDLAAGVAPEANATLACRAQALVRPSMRRELASSVQQLLREAARRPTRGFAGARVPIRHDRVLAAADTLELLVDRLLAPGPVPARGVARVRVLLTDGAGPLYYPGCSDDLPAVALDALEQLEPLHSW